jgi:hypothetical protein
MVRSKLGATVRSELGTTSPCLSRELALGASGASWLGASGARAAVDENWVPRELVLNGRTETVPGGKNIRVLPAAAQ